MGKDNCFCTYFRGRMSDTQTFGFALFWNGEKLLCDEVCENIGLSAKQIICTIFWDPSVGQFLYFWYGSFCMDYFAGAMYGQPLLQICSYLTKGRFALPNSEPGSIYWGLYCCMPRWAWSGLCDALASSSVVVGKRIVVPQSSQQHQLLPV